MQQPRRRWSIKPRGPDLLAVEPPALRRARGAGAHAGQIGARIGLAHADAEEGLAAADARDVEGLLLRRAVLDDERAALPIGDPVRSHRGAGDQQLFRQHEARKRAASATTQRLGQGDAHPTARGQGAAEVRIEAGPGARPLVRRALGQRALQELPHFQAQGLVLGRDTGKLQRVDHGRLHLVSVNK